MPLTQLYAGQTASGVTSAVGSTQQSMGQNFPGDFYNYSMYNKSTTNTHFGQPTHAQRPPAPNTPITRIDYSSIHTISQFKQPIFPADLGQYCQTRLLPKYNIKVLTVQKFIKAVLLKSSLLSDRYELTDQILRKQYQFVLALLHRSPGAMERVLNYQTLCHSGEIEFCLFHEPVEITLAELIKSGELEYEDKMEIMSQIMAVLEYLESEGICHRFLSPGNLVFVRVDDGTIWNQGKFVPYEICKEEKKKWAYLKQNCVLKVCGFYQAVNTKTKHDRQSCKVILSNPYSDPNLSTYQKPQYKCDYWSILIIFFELLTGRMPDLRPESDWRAGINLLKWQEDIFAYYFQGTNKVSITLRDLKIRVKNMNLTSRPASKLMQQLKNRQANKRNNFNEEYSRVNNSFVPRPVLRE